MPSLLYILLLANRRRKKKLLKVFVGKVEYYCGLDSLYVKIKLKKNRKRRTERPTPPYTQDSKLSAARILHKMVCFLL